MKRAIVSSCTPAPQLLDAVSCGGIVNAPAVLAALSSILGATPAAPATAS